MEQLLFLTPFLQGALAFPGALLLAEKAVRHIYNQIGELPSSRLFYKPLWFFALSLLGAVIAGGANLSLGLASLSALLVAGALVDAKHKYLPDWITIPAAVLALYLSSMTPQAMALGVLWVGMVLWLPGFIYETFCKAQGLGGGDVKLMLVPALLAGDQGVLNSVSWAIASLVIFTLLKVVFTRKISSATEEFALGPWLVIGIFATIFSVTYPQLSLFHWL